MSEHEWAGKEMHWLLSSGHLEKFKCAVLQWQWVKGTVGQGDCGLEENEEWCQLPKVMLATFSS